MHSRAAHEYRSELLRHSVSTLPSGHVAAKLTDRPPSNINLHDLAPDDGIAVTGDTRNPFSTPLTEEGESLPSKSTSQRSRQKDPHVRSMDTPTFGTYLLLRRRLGEIVAMITQNFQQLNGQGSQGSYKEIERIGGEMKRFVSSLPRCFKMEDPDKSMDKGMCSIAVSNSLQVTR